MTLLSGSWKRSYVEKASMVFALAPTTWWWILIALRLLQEVLGRSPKCTVELSIF